jgi:hypothetical protein
VKDERKSRLPRCLETEGGAEELTQAAVGGVNARARRGRVRLDVHGGHAAPRLELGVRPGGSPRHHQLQAGDQEQNRPGPPRMPDERLPSRHIGRVLVRATR